MCCRTWATWPGRGRRTSGRWRIDERAFGPDHPNVATDVNNLGGVLQDLGDLAGARAAFERALAIDERAFGPDHPNVATDVNNLGSVLQDLGDLAGARAAFERALAIDERAYGPDHPNVATDVNNLGSVLQDLGDLAGARAAFERALAHRRAGLRPRPSQRRHRRQQPGECAAGPGRPGRGAGGVRAGAGDRRAGLRPRPSQRGHATSTTWGVVLQDLGDLAGARAAYERALAHRRAGLRPRPSQRRHATSTTWGVCCRTWATWPGRGRRTSGRWRIDERAFGPDHPNVATDVNNLGSVLQDLGDLAGARAAYERALADLRKVLAGGAIPPSDRAGQPGTAYADPPATRHQPSALFAASAQRRVAAGDD